MTITPQCLECGADVDLEFTATGTTDHEEFWGRPVSVESVEIEFECDLKCPECGFAFDGDALIERATEAAAEYV